MNKKLDRILDSIILSHILDKKFTLSNYENKKYSIWATYNCWDYLRNLNFNQIFRKNNFEIYIPSENCVCLKGALTVL